MLSQFQFLDHAHDSTRSVYSLSSSPSTESYHSSAFPYTEESDDGRPTHTGYPRMPTPTQLDLVDPVYASSMHSDETGFEQFPVLGSPSLLFYDPDSQHLLESCIQSTLTEDENVPSNSLLALESIESSPPQTSASPPPSPQTLATSCDQAAATAATVHPVACSSPTDHCLISDKQSSQPERPTRPHSLAFRALIDSPKSNGLLSQTNDMPLSFNNPFFGLEEQLASADIAWMGALDIPNICLDEVDKLLSPTSCITSPVGDAVTSVIGSASTRASQRLCLRKTNCHYTEVTCPSNSDRTMEQPSGPDDSDSIEFQSRIPDSSKRIPNELADSDSTLTCSEAEYYSNWIQLHGTRTRRKRVRPSRLRRRERWETETEGDTDTDSGTDEPREWNPQLLKRLSTTGTRRSAVPHMHRRQSKSTSDEDLKPWWPKTNTPFWTGCGISVDIPDSVDEVSSSDGRPSLIGVEDDQLMCCTSDPDGTPRSNDSGCSCSMNSSPRTGTSKVPGTSISSLTHNYNQTNHNTTNNAGGNTSSNYHHKFKSKSSAHSMSDRLGVDAKCHQPIWRARRRRKQLELWQFILCKLETSKQSAFRWVNRSAGVFCITDTIAGAREWGRYRNNSRMDYEKMARAMRFYYKDSILRKSRQQLHFQFAMSYVEWASRFYHSA
ncbi:unnamed protein product [Echinostoma caproni]|uniref:ETS domain-containing protein n=1 Tax=Echinostoma caproni TaxID=27848 RepID=A0A183AB89_9TREM|nr:unnamed protein product [Echinostoma caproni]